MTNNAYYYIGNQIVFDPNFLLQSKKSKGLHSVDASFLTKSRPTTASSKNYSPLVRKFMTPQPTDEPIPRPLSSQGTNSK